MGTSVERTAAATRPPTASIGPGEYAWMFFSFFGGSCCHRAFTRSPCVFSKRVTSSGESWFERMSTSVSVALARSRDSTCRPPSSEISFLCTSNPRSVEFSESASMSSHAPSS